VDDLVEAMIRMMATPDEVIGPINIGNPGEFTMLELAEEVQRLVGSTCEIVHEPLPQDDPKMRKPDIAVARELLGWEPRMPLAQGLARTVDYFRQIVDGAVLSPTIGR
jgi:UDP-glucuronate decarboxylase